ncbi:hypothetical protein AALO_G00309820, partial [Alosa alosa]
MKSERILFSWSWSHSVCEAYSSSVQFADCLVCCRGCCTRLRKAKWQLGAQTK